MKPTRDMRVVHQFGSYSFGRKRLLKILIASACLSISCGGSSGFIRDSLTAHQFQYKIDVSRLTYIKSAFGSAEKSSILCFIPIGERDMYQLAVSRMYQEAQLKPGQIIINLREDHSSTFYLFYCKSKFTVSGDVFDMNR